MIDLVLTHLTHPWGPPWTLETLGDKKKRKLTSHTQLWVYNSENRFVGSFYQFTCRVKSVKRYFEKSVFWDRLIYRHKSHFKEFVGTIIGTWQ